MTSSYTDFINSVVSLEANGSNWSIFQSRLEVAVRSKRVWGHFDGSTPKPVKKEKQSEDSYEKALLKWQENEDTARYLLTSKLPDSIFSKYKRLATVAEMWKKVEQEFTQKSMIVRSNLRAEFMALRYEKGADLRQEFDRVRMKYEDLLGAGIEVSDDDYRTLIITFVPIEISAFIAQISAQLKLFAQFQPEDRETTPMVTVTDAETTTTMVVGSASTASKRKGILEGIDPEVLMQTALDEWDRQEVNRKTRGIEKEQTHLPPADGTAVVAVSNDEPNQRGGNGRGRGYGRGRGGYYRGPVVCWNCEGKGHRAVECASPQREDYGGEANQGEGAQASNGNGPSVSRPSANTGILDFGLESRPVYGGAWSASLIKESDRYGFLCEEEDLPELIEDEYELPEVEEVNDEDLPCLVEDEDLPEVEEDDVYAFLVTDEVDRVEVVAEEEDVEDTTESPSTVEIDVDTSTSVVEGGVAECGSQEPVVTKAKEKHETAVSGGVTDMEALTRGGENGLHVKAVNEPDDKHEKGDVPREMFKPPDLPEALPILEEAFKAVSEPVDERAKEDVPREILKPPNLSDASDVLEEINKVAADDAVRVENPIGKILWCRKEILRILPKKNRRRRTAKTFSSMRVKLIRRRFVSKDLEPVAVLVDPGGRLPEDETYEEGESTQAIEAVAIARIVDRAVLPHAPIKEAFGYRARIHTLSPRIESKSEDSHMKEAANLGAPRASRLRGSVGIIGASADVVGALRVGPCLHRADVLPNTERSDGQLFKLSSFQAFPRIEGIRVH